MSVVNNNCFSRQVQKIVNILDALDGKDNVIKSETWKQYAPSELQYNANSNADISIFEASSLISNVINNESVLSGQTKENIVKKWHNNILNIFNNKYASGINESDFIERADALYVDNSKNIIAANLSVVQNEFHACEKDKIVSDMYNKWSKIFNNSPLGKDFYNKLYDVIKILNCTINDCDFKPKLYSNKIEQTMDEVIAIFAGESKLNPKAVNGQYKGLFQVAGAGLTDLKQWAAKNKDVPGMNNIKNININQFGTLSGCDQLDYLVAYIGKAKEYSRIPKNQSITPGQLWAMIKQPFKGQPNSSVTAQKGKAIQKVFEYSSVPQGSAV